MHGRGSVCLFVFQREKQDSQINVHPFFCLLWVFLSAVNFCTITIADMATSYYWGNDKRFQEKTFTPNSLPRLQFVKEQLKPSDFERSYMHTHTHTKCIWGVGSSLKCPIKCNWQAGLNHWCWPAWSYFGWLAFWCLIIDSQNGCPDTMA